MLKYWVKKIKKKTRLDLSDGVGKGTLFNVYLTLVISRLLEDIRISVNKGLALGNKRFTSPIEALTKKRVTARNAGRPKKESD